MDLDVVFLGTSASTPTALRSPSALLVRRGGERLLVDCGEGTQRQLLKSVAGLADLDDVLITHFHADHILGLPGMLKTFALRGREEPLRIHGPAGLGDVLGSFRRILGRLTYPLEAIELQPGETIDRHEYRLETFALDHGVPALGYALVEPDRPGRFDSGAADALGVPNGRERGELQRGQNVTLADGTVVAPHQVLGETRAGRRLVMAGDTRPCASVLAAAAGADLLVHEATFLGVDRPRALETQHSTAGEAALLAREAGVALLALTHLSSRYYAPDVAAEARQVFPSTIVASDFDRVELPFAERGTPRHVVRGARLHRGGGRRGGCTLETVSGRVHVAVAGTVAEAEELQALLTAAGIASELEPLEGHDRDALDDAQLGIVVAEHDLEPARDAIEALTEPDDPLGT